MTKNHKDRIINYRDLDEENPLRGSFYSKNFIVFMRAIEEKKFSAAAERLRLTQSSVSQSITMLEKGLGVTLFDRVTRPPQPTKEAITLYEVLKKSESEIRRVLTNIQYDNSVKPAVRIGMIESIGKIIASDVCKSLKKELGLVSLVSEPSGTLMKQLKEGSLDIAILAGEENHEEISKHFLAFDPWLFIFPKTFPLLEGTLSFENLKFCGLPFIYHSKDTADGNLLTEYFRTHNLSFPKVFEIQTNAIMYDLVAAGLGWSVSHMLGLLSQDKNKDFLKIYSVSDELKPRKIYFCARKDFDVRASDKVLACIRELIKGFIS